MSNPNHVRAPVTAQSTGDTCVVSVDLPAPPERVFRALASNEITDWWVRPGIWDVREWSGDVRAGGRWHANGTVQGQPYAIGGEFRDVDVPHRLVHTIEGPGTPEVPSLVTCQLEPTTTGTRLTLRQSGFRSKDLRDRFALGWETSFARLAEILGNGERRNRGVEESRSGGVGVMTRRATD